MIKSVFRLVIAASICWLIGIWPVDAHIEGALFVEHPPKTAFGLRIQSSHLTINNYNHAFSITPFAEYAPVSRLSVGVGLPTGWFEGRYLVSDLVIAAKGDLPVKNFKIVPMLSAELPTGTDPATSHHTELVTAVFLEKKVPNCHFYGYPGIRFALESEENEHQGKEHDVNVFTPHTERELFLNTGVSYWITDHIGVDGRVTSYYEDFDNFTAQFQSGVVYQTSTKGEHTLKTSIDGFYVPSGIRAGYGGGLSFYMAI